MAASKDTPGARRQRDKATGRTEKGARRSAEEPAPRRVYGRRVGAGERVPLVASAARIDLNDRKAIQNARRRRQAWQTEAWDYCVDEETEILTENGWRTRPELAVGDLVLVLDPSSHVARWEPVLAVNTFPARPRAMVSMEGRDHSSLTTLRHRWPVLRYEWQARPGRRPVRLPREPAWGRSSTLCYRDSLVSAAPVADLPTEPKYADAFVELVAWLWTEGTVYRGRVSIYQSHAVNAPYVARIRAALTALLGPEASLGQGRVPNPTPAWREHRPRRSTVTAFKLNKAASALLLAVAPVRTVRPDFLRALTKSQLELFIATSVAAEGHVAGGCTVVGQKDRAQLEALELAVVLSGRTPRTHRDRTQDRWLMSIRDRASAGVRNLTCREVQTCQVVWCPTTPSGTWLARRRGTVYFTGNTDEVGEIGYAVDFAGNLLSKVRLFAAVRPDPHSEPVPVDDPDANVDADTAKLCVETLERLRSREGGLSALIREATINFDVAGEFYLHGHEDPDTGEEDWQIRSVDELVVTGDSFALRGGPGANVTEPIPASDLVVRMWMRHPRFSLLATCAMRRVLGEAESLLLLSREVRATARSRLSAGLLLVPSEISFSAADPTRDPSDGEGTDDPFEDELTTAMVTPIQQEGSAGAVVPLVVRGPAEYLAAIRHLELQKGLDPALDARIEGRVLRVARGLNMPVETVTGMMNTTFANAATIKKSEWDAHGQPRAVLLVDAFTAGYFQPALEEAGVPAAAVRDFFIWYDPADAISAPDPVDNVEKAHEDGIVSDQARRRVQGFAESDAPDDAELLRRIIFQSPRMDPFILAQLLKLTGLVPDLMIPAPAAGEVTEDGALRPESLPPTKALPVAAATSPPGARRTALGRRLTAIDRDLRTRVHAAAEAAMRQALERAGNRIKGKANRSRSGELAAHRRVADGVAAAAVASALGPSMVAALGLSDEELLSDSLDGVIADFGTWVAAAQAEAISAVEAVAGPLDEPVRVALATAQVTNREAATAQLTRRLQALGAQRLYDPSPGATPLGEQMPSTLVPVSIVREALAVAGGEVPGGGPEDGVTVGGPLTAADGGPVGGVATGPDVMDVVGAAGGAVEGYEWDYGGAVRHPFEPHLALDGVQFVNFDDEVLTNDEGWPDVPYFQPGDHDGCTCDITPTIVFVESPEISVDSEA